MGTGSARPSRSLRRRLVLVIIVTAALAAFAEALLLHVVWYGYEARLIDRVVRDELGRSLEIHEREPRLAYPNTEALRLYVASSDPAMPGDPLPPQLRPLLDDPLADAVDGIAIREVTSIAGETYHVGVARRGGRTFLLAYDAQEHEARRFDLLLAVLAIAGLLTWLGASVASRVVDRMLGGLSRLQRRVASGRFDGELREPGLDEEVDALAAALDDQRAQVAAALRKERAFAAAASHELRTPLTRIATGAEVLLAGGNLPSAATERVRAIRAAVDELQRLLDVLLQVARARPGVGPGVAPTSPPRPLADVVTACVDALRTEAQRLGATIGVSLSTPALPVAHPALLEVVLANLVRNAIRHGRGAPVEIVERGGLLEVVDGGPGIDPAALGRVFDPFWRGADPAEAGPAGLGLGLTIAERVCAAAGWTLSIVNGAVRGTRAQVRLDAGAGA